MPRLYILFALLSLAACSDVLQPPTPAVPTRAAARASEGAGYIVVLREEAGATPAAARARAQRVASEAGVRPARVFGAVLQGFAAELTAGQLAALRRRPDVAYVEPDAPVRLFTTQANPISWGLDRVDDVNLPLDQTFTYTKTGAGVRAYVLGAGGHYLHPCHPRCVQQRALQGRAAHAQAGTVPEGGIDRVTAVGVADAGDGVPVERHAEPGERCDRPRHQPFTAGLVDDALPRLEDAHVEAGPGGVQGGGQPDRSPAGDQQVTHRRARRGGCGARRSPPGSARSAGRR